MDTAMFKSTLEQMKLEVSERLGRIENHIHHKEAPLSQDFAEQAVEVQNDDVVFALDDVLVAELNQINAALRRIEEDVFGTCLDCGQEISLPRLQAVPFTTKCSDCARSA